MSLVQGARLWISVPELGLRKKTIVPFSTRVNFIDLPDEDIGGL